MSEVIKISSNEIKQAIDNLVNENKLLQDKIYKQNEEIERLKKNQKLTPEERNHLHLELDEIVESLQLENERLNNIINELEHDFESYELEYLQDTYQGSLADFIETELERIQELKGSDKE